MERDPVITSAQRGSALVVVILSTALVGYLSYRLAIHCTAYRNFVLSYLRGFSQQQSVREQLMPVATPSRTCVTQTVAPTLATTQSWKVCTLGTPPFLTNPQHSLPSHRIDFAAVFRNAASCRYGRTTNLEEIFSGPKAGTTCIVPNLLSEPLITLDNISIQEVALRLSPNSSSLILATPGTLQSEGTLSLNAPSLIVAGGDIRIAALKAESIEPITVTILSAHGDIIVGQVLGPVSVLSIGRQLLSVPPTPPSSVFILPPFMTRPSIAGIIPVNG